MRTWSDSSGQFTIQARFVAVLPNNVVRLQKDDGTYTRIEAKLLSPGDVAFIFGPGDMLAVK